ncbi:MAG: hypothetical protein ACTSPB_03090 [Candidatus Thorarchaeota archaeon]
MTVQRVVCKLEEIEDLLVLANRVMYVEIYNNRNEWTDKVSADEVHGLLTRLSRCAELSHKLEEMLLRVHDNCYFG